ncbi:MAG: chorismate mutase [Candidatus Nanoarchaeia archaeon]|nr:chorismate mutase [Candidatus Nanoarchaeia archaeon]
MDSGYEQKLNEYRGKLDGITKEIIDLIYERIGIVKKVGYLKKQHNMPIKVSKREEEIMNKIENMVIRKNLENSIELDPSIIKRFF